MNHLRGLPSTRYIRALGVGQGRLTEAQAFAASQDWRNTPEVMRALQTPLDSTSGAALLPEIAFDFSEFIRPLTILGRLIGARRVPFRVRLLTGTGGAVAYFVGSGQPKPLSAAAFDGETMDTAKVVSIAVVTDELLRSSAPSADAVLSGELGRACSAEMDRQFIDPAASGTPGEIPASVTNGAVPINSTGSTLAAIDADLGAMVEALSAAGSDLQFAVWIMPPRTATFLARLRGTGGALAYPGMTVKGGTLLGLPVLTSAGVPISADTGNPSTITLLDASAVTYADDGESALSVSRNASLQMVDNPQSGAAQQVSLWQMGLTGIKAERVVNWKLRRPFVQVLDQVTF